MGIDAMILATTSRKLTHDELVECSRRLSAAVPYYVEHYADVPDGDESAEPVPAPWERDTPRDVGALCLQHRPDARLDDFRNLPDAHFVYEVCTLSRSVYLTDAVGAVGGETGGRGNGIHVAAMAEALDLLMDVGTTPPWPRGPAPDWRVWLGNDASYDMRPFPRSERYRMFTAYLRTEMGVDEESPTPCPVCGSLARLYHPADGVCAACLHDPKTGKQHRPTKASWDHAIPRDFSAMPVGERCKLMRDLGEYLQHRGLQHSVVDALKSYDEGEGP